MSYQRKVPITVAKGDGIGPEIMDATMAILTAAGAQLDPEYVVVGEEAFKQGILNGVTQHAWESLRRTRVFLKAPLYTPSGGGYKSVNVTMRKSFGMFANIRPVRTFEPFIKTKHKGVDLVIVRENEEDLYAGIEYRQTLNTCHSVKFMSRTGTEMIIRFAFEYARAYGRKKVTALMKDNIMKISDGLFHKTFDLVGKEYPDIQQDAMIVDIGMAKVADQPENFDVIVTLNLYGDIVSDIASQIAGSVGQAGSVNLGRDFAMFEAVHGCAPDIAGQGIANPSGLLNGALLMLSHIGQAEVSERIGNAWLYTIENGQHTGDIAADKSKALNTQQFAQAVIDNLGKFPKTLQALSIGKGKLTMPEPERTTRTPRTKRVVGADIFVEWPGTDPNILGQQVERCQTQDLKLTVISSRGMKMYPGTPETPAVTDEWRCRFRGDANGLPRTEIRRLLANFDAMGINWTKVESLCTFDHEQGFSGIQGE